MSILAVNDLEKYYGAACVLAGVNLEINHGQRLALIGRNGCGKTTLLKIVAGLEEQDRGTVSLAQGLRLGYLAQEFLTGETGCTLWAEVESVFAGLNAIELELARLSDAMTAGGDALPETMQRYAKLQEEFERRDGYVVRKRVEKVLRGLGFTEDDWQKPIGVLSGGEKTRTALAKLLLAEPDLLLLDEPTNHLDLWAVAWLEEYLADYRGAILVVSHDRFFLDRIVNGLYEMAEGKLRYYRGNYTAYRNQRLEEQRVLQHAQAMQQKEIARKERLVRESAADERSKRQARSIAKSIGRIERIDALPAEIPSMRLDLKTAAHHNRIALTVNRLSKSFEGKPLLQAVDFQLEYGEKVGIIGPNGVGKTTLLRLLTGALQPDSGSIILGHNMHPGILSQEEKQQEAGTVFSACQTAGAGDNQATRSHLAKYLFRGEEVWKEVASLSGGERRRLALACLTLSEANLLYLDEPTNHLDLASIEALEEGISQYDGTVLVVSHDRYFLGRIADRLLAMVNGTLMPFPDYASFAAWHAAEESRLMATRQRETEARKAKYLQEKEARQAPLREEKRRAKAAAALETSLTAKEQEKAELLATMALPEIAADFEALRLLSIKLAELEQEIAALYTAWEEAMG